jgi:hypothetical protein
LASAEEMASVHRQSFLCSYKMIPRGFLNKPLQTQDHKSWEIKSDPMYAMLVQGAALLKERGRRPYISEVHKGIRIHLRASSWGI